MMTKEVEGIDPALVARMVELARGVAGCYPVEGKAQGVGSIWINIARDIAADLLPPVDPDLIEARAIALEFSLPASVSGMCSYRVRQGDFDNHDVVFALTAAIKRGRELAQVSA